METSNNNIPGYQHPTSINTHNKLSKYKTFTDGVKTKKYGDATTSGNHYVLSKQINNKINIDICPVCKQEAVYISNSVYSNKSCNNGHNWYFDRDGVVKIGKP